MLSYLVLSFSADLTCHDSNADDPNHIQYIYQDRGGRQECVSVVQVVQDTVLLTRDAAISGKLKLKAAILAWFLPVELTNTYPYSMYPS